MERSSSQSANRLVDAFILPLEATKADSSLKRESMLE